VASPLDPSVAAVPGSVALPVPRADHRSGFPAVSSPHTRRSPLRADPSGIDTPSVLRPCLKDLQRAGPTEDELVDDLEEGRVVHEDPRSALDKAANAAVEHLHHGRVWDPDAARAERESVNPSGVRAALADYPATAILTVPQGVVPDLDEYRSYPDHVDAPVSGRVFTRRVFGPVPRGARLVIGDEGVSLVLRDGAATVRWDDIVGYGQGPEGLGTLYGGDGCTIDLHPLFFKAGEEAMTLVEARVPAAVRFQQSLPEPHTADKRS
jgi:hypothetical protein